MQRILLAFSVALALLYVQCVAGGRVENGQFVRDDNARRSLLRDFCTSQNDCGACSQASGCGWCGYAGKCVPGTSSGPTVGSCPGDTWQFQQCSCGSYASCDQCIDAPLCGWCASSGRCMNGTRTGPNPPNSCSSWSYVSCSPSPAPSPIPNPTPSPIFNPTPSPIFNPTPSPIFNPTPSPISNPTPTPIPNPTPAPSTFTQAVAIPSNLSNICFANQGCSAIAYPLYLCTGDSSIPNNACIYNSTTLNFTVAVPSNKTIVSLSLASINGIITEFSGGGTVGYDVSFNGVVKGSFSVSTIASCPLPAGIQLGSSLRSDWNLLTLSWNSQITSSSIQYPRICYSSVTLVYQLK